MGFDNRDYARQESRDASWTASQGWSAVKWIIVINAVIFVVQLLTFDQGKDHVTRWFDLEPEAVFSGQVWRVLTYAFLHNPQSVWHIFFNMMVLAMMGPMVETLRGSREFVAFYLVAALLSGLAFLAWGAFLHDLTPAVGASGSVTAVVIFYAMKYPHHEWRIYGIIPVKAYVVAIFTVVIDLFPMLRQIGGSGFSDNIAHSAHLGGALFGYLYHRYDWWLIHGLPSWRGISSSWRRSRSQLKIHQPSIQPDDIDDTTLTARADRILQKLAEEGEGSLTAADRQTLEEQSRRLRARRTRT